MIRVEALLHSLTPRRCVVVSILATTFICVVLALLGIKVLGLENAVYQQMRVRSTKVEGRVGELESHYSKFVTHVNGKFVNVRDLLDQHQKAVQTMMHSAIEAASAAANDAKAPQPPPVNAPTVPKRMPAAAPPRSSSVASKPVKPDAPTKPPRKATPKVEELKTPPKAKVLPPVSSAQSAVKTKKKNDSKAPPDEQPGREPAAAKQPPVASEAKPSPTKTAIKAKPSPTKTASKAKPSPTKTAPPLAPNSDAVPASPKVLMPDGNEIDIDNASAETLDKAEKYVAALIAAGGSP